MPVAVTNIKVGDEDGNVTEFQAGEEVTGLTDEQLEELKKAGSIKDSADDPDPLGFDESQSPGNLVDSAVVMAQVEEDEDPESNEAVQEYQEVTEAAGPAGETERAEAEAEKADEEEPGSRLPTEE
jgi:hypothetical protein